MAKQQTTKTHLTKTTKKHKRNDSQTMSNNNNNAIYNASATFFSGGAAATAPLKRIRTPHAHDVLSGRGGGINGHEGNCRFRAWVAERKEDYNLATNKAEKARVAREVIAIVQAQDPAGRFLQKDPTSIGAGGPNWWIEISDEKVMAKTSQALREGAPQIRAAHKDELTGHQLHQLEKRRTARQHHRKSPTKGLSETTGTAATTTTTSPPHTTALAVKRKIGYVEPEGIPSQEQARAIAELQLHLQEAEQQSSMNTEEQQRLEARKRVRMDYNGTIVRPTDVTPPLQPTAVPPHQEVPEIPSFPGPLSAEGNMRRIHSLAFSDASETNNADYLTGDFINPFEDESDLELNKPPAPIPGVLRQSSVASDMGGYGALFQSDVSAAANSPVSAAAATNANSSTKATPSISSLFNNKNNNNAGTGGALGSPSSSSSSERSRNSRMNNNNRSLSVLSDLPDACPPRNHPETDFTEGMKTIYDALHPDVEDETIPTHLFPYRGVRRHSSGTYNANRLPGNGRQ